MVVIHTPALPERPPETLDLSTKEERGAQAADVVATADIATA